MQIPEQLVEMLKSRRVIPFIGAGFSAAVGMPEWDSLLRAIAPEIQGAPEYEVIKKCCNGDHLQIAEYYFLKLDRSVGPLRHRLASLLQPNASLLTSTAHIELVNLNAQQIYTTNYDENIEQTFKNVGCPYEVVALPKHIASAGRTKSQVVKYHGDLRYDHTLVLTESSYYSRLEFESPLDLKFRSDLLGRSVLFLGYSFRDINIRIIWFKLMEMMKDVPDQDRPSSFVVRFERNEVLEELYAAVGIRTIYLDQEGKAKTADARTALLGHFMMELSLRISDDGRMPGGTSPMYVSPRLLSEVRESTKKSRTSHLLLRRDVVTSLARHLSGRTTPIGVRGEVDLTLRELSANLGRVPEITEWALQQYRQGPPNTGAALYLMLSLTRTKSRSTILGIVDFPWRELWSTRLSDADAELIIAALGNEIEHHQHEWADVDIAYAADLVTRLSRRLLIDDPDIANQAEQILAEASKLYPSIQTIAPVSDGAPDVDQVLAEVRERLPDPDSEDDIPF